MRSIPGSINKIPDPGNAEKAVPWEAFESADRAPINKAVLSSNLSPERRPRFHPDLKTRSDLDVSWGGQCPIAKTPCPTPRGPGAA